METVVSKRKGAVTSGLINLSSIGVAFIALYSIITPRIDDVAAKQYNDHGVLTATAGDITTIKEDTRQLKDDVSDLKRVIYNAAPRWGINPDAGKIASSSML